MGPFDSAILSKPKHVASIDRHSRSLWPGVSGVKIPNLYTEADDNLR